MYLVFIVPFIIQYTRTVVPSLFDQAGRTAALILVTDRGGDKAGTVPRLGLWGPLT